MNKYQQVKAHLPPLYQPEEQDTSLLNSLLKEMGANMDEISRQLTVVMQSHWFKTADKATYDNHFIVGRSSAGLGVVDLHSKQDQEAIAAYPYILDLARVGALLSIPPWREPITLRETVEEYRKRLLRIIAIYRNGLGTLDAIRRMVTAELPEDSDLLLSAQQRSFSIEENVPYVGTLESINSIGLPVETIGPLMRWNLSNNDIQAAAPVIYIEGVEDTDDEDATVSPLVEQFNLNGSIDPQGSLVGLGIAYTGTIAPEVTLRLKPAFGAFLSGAAGIQQAQLSDTQVGLSHWQTVVGAPEGDVTASMQTADKLMWFALDNEDDPQLWRYNGTDWLQVLTTQTLAPIHCLHQRQQNLLIGTDDGLLEMPLYPNGSDPFVANSVAEFLANPVYCIELSDRNQLQLYVGSANGLVLLNGDNTISDSIIVATPIRAVTESDTVLYFGGDLGVMQYRFRSSDYFYLSAAFESELEVDWISFEIAELPESEEFGLPGVLSLLLGDDDSLWIGTMEGLARYRARKEAESVYRALLEGFTDLVDGAVVKMNKDEYGFVWFATNRGLLRFDGRDLARYDLVNDRWAQLGQADQLYNGEASAASRVLPRGLWRYNRTLHQWEVFNYTAQLWTNFSDEIRLEEEPTVDLVFVDRVKATLGTLASGATHSNDFTVTSEVPDNELMMRCKPDLTRIVNGGLPSIPRVSKGSSTWRYLSLEPEGLVDSTDLPWWSIEGRLVPPPDHDAPYPGRFSEINQTPYQLGQMIYAYNPAAKIKCQWVSHKPLRVLVRLLTRDSADIIDPAIIDRVWQGIGKVKPAGIHIQLAVDEQTVKGEQS